MLEHYLAILEGRRAPRFREAGRQRRDVSDVRGSSDDALWAAHGARQDSVSGVSLLEIKAELAWRSMSPCRLCGRRCGAHRHEDERGRCGVGEISRVASEFLHMGEEPELVPSHTVFFTGCTLACAYCQNWDIATRPDSGAPVEPRRLARSIERRHEQGSRNVNFVGGDPAPHIATILATLVEVEADVPVVFNSNMYLSDTALRLLDGVVDVYLADFRYGNDECARRLSSVPRYFETVAEAFLEADRQTDVMLRHLVLPGHLDCCTEPIMAWVREHMPAVYFNLMFQYRPCHHAGEFPELRRGLTEEDIRVAARLASEYRVCWRT